MRLSNVAFWLAVLLMVGAVLGWQTGCDQPKTDWNAKAGTASADRVGAGIASASTQTSGAAKRIVEDVDRGRKASSQEQLEPTWLDLLNVATGLFKTSSDIQTMQGEVTALKAEFAKGQAALVAVAKALQDEQAARKAENAAWEKRMEKESAHTRLLTYFLTGLAVGIALYLRKWWVAICAVLAGGTVVALTLGVDFAVENWPYILASIVSVAVLWNAADAIRRKMKHNLSWWDAIISAVATGPSADLADVTETNPVAAGILTPEGKQ